MSRLVMLMSFNVPLFIDTFISVKGSPAVVMGTL